MLFEGLSQPAVSGGREWKDWSEVFFFFFFITRLGFLAAWLSCGCSFSRTCHDVCEHEFIPLAGRKEGRSVGWLVGWFGRRETRLPAERKPKKKKKRCEGFKCQWLLHQLLAALVAADISPDGRSASLLFNVALLRFVYLFIFFLFCNLQSHNFFVFCWLFSVLNVQVLYLQIFQIPFL